MKDSEMDLKIGRDSKLMSFFHLSDKSYRIDFTKFIIFEYQQLSMNERFKTGDKLALLMPLKVSNNITHSGESVS